MRTGQLDVSALGSERLGQWMFWSLILAFELLGVLLSNHSWDPSDADDDDSPPPIVASLARDDIGRAGSRGAELDLEGYTVVQAREETAALTNTR